MNWIKLIASILICEAAGVIGGIFTAQSVDTWYTNLEKPSFTPPNWLFGPAWITLYFLMGISAYLIWNQGLENKAIKTALIFFILQLLVNAAWSFLFFGLQSPLFGLIDIVILIVLIVITMVKFYPLSHLATYLLIPYLLWVLYATALNTSILILN